MSGLMHDAALVLFGTSRNPLVRIVRALVVVALALLALEIVWAGIVLLALVLLIARRIHPGVPAAWFFSPPRSRFSALVIATGSLAFFGGVHVYEWAQTAASDTWGVVGIVCIALSAAGAWVIVLTFEGMAMKDVFEMIPPAQRGGLQEFLAGKATAGQQASFARLDEAQVTASVQHHVIGQDRCVCDVVHTSFQRAELIRPGKPLATYLFVGPTGVGKSELAKALAGELFAGRLIDLPLNQMQDQSDLSTLLGSPRGYIGNEEGGTLTREIGRLGTGVIVLDEFEKSHPSIRDACMRLLDTGQITERSTGDVYSARGFLMIGTSNAAAEEVGKLAAVEMDPDELGRKVRKALVAAGLKPEILSRFDAIFPFRPLDRRDVARVVGVMVQRHAAAVGVQVASLDADLLVSLIEKQEAGADAGMRNLDRAVERAVLDGLLAARKRGDQSVAIRVMDGAVNVEAVS